MATDLSKPVASDGYAALIAGINTAFRDAARGYEPALTGTHTNIPTGMLRWNAATFRDEKFDGTSWVPKAATYAINISGSAGSAGTATNQSGGTVSATSGAFSGRVSFPSSVGTTWIDVGTGDSASYSTHNTRMHLHWGLGIEDYSGAVNGVYDARTGTWRVKNGFVADGNGASVQFGGAASSGFFADATNVVIRGTNSLGGIYFQSPGGAATYGSVSGAGFSTAIGFSGPGTNLTGTAASLNAGLGAGQTWQNFTGSRSYFTNYTNSTGRSIVASISGYRSAAGGAVIAIYVGGLSVEEYVGSGSLGDYASVSAIVPAGAVYRVEASNMNAPGWVELTV